jgi:UDP-N-acetyl-D-mannosaminuronate dehydrogenase
LKKNIVAGLGEIGLPILKLISKKNVAVGYDINPNLMNNTKFKKYNPYQTEILHVCIPFNNNFISNVISLSQKFNPELIVIHSTIPPLTTKKLQKKSQIPIIYSATRGIHRRMLNDLKKYTKFFALEPNAPKAKWASNTFSKLMRNSCVKTKRMSTPVALELAKIVVDTTYYGWLINYAQLSNMIAHKYDVNYDEMWTFSDEIHKFLGNRPKMYPGFIGGHCVIPNLSLIDEESFWQIDKINNLYSKKVKNAKSIAKKYVKGTQSYDSK